MLDCLKNYVLICDCDCMNFDYAGEKGVFKCLHCGHEIHESEAGQHLTSIDDYAPDERITAENKRKIKGFYKIKRGDYLEGAEGFESAYILFSRYFKRLKLASLNFRAYERLIDPLCTIADMDFYELDEEKKKRRIYK